MSDPADMSGMPRPPREAEDDAHAERLAAILADPSLPDRDKRQAIQEALDDLQRERGDEPAASYEPLQMRFFEALSLLAEGGHDYGEADGDADRASPQPRRVDAP